MTYRDIFGRDLTEYELEIITNSGLAEAQWEVITRQSRAYRAFHDQRSTRHFITKLLRGAGVAGAVLGTLSKATFNWASQGDSSTTPKNKNGKRLRDGVADLHISPKAKRSLTHDFRGRQPRSLPNTTASEQAAIMTNDKSLGSGNNAGLSETPIDDVEDVRMGPRDYQYAKLPWMYDRAVVTSSNLFDQWTFRMNSPYDVSVATTISDANAGTGVANYVVPTANDLTDSVQQQAWWYQFYADQYKYYHVVSARWHLTFENMGTEPLYVHSYYSNEVDRPWQASNRDMLMWPDMESHWVGPIAHAINNNGRRDATEAAINFENDDVMTGAGADLPPSAQANYQSGNMITPRGPSNILKLSGEYRPGDYNKEIRLDADVENWTAVTTNPSLAERHTFRIKHGWNAIPPTAGDNFAYGDIYAYRFQYRVEYLVEFKELKDTLKYPVNEQPLRVTITQNQNAN